MSHRTQSGGSYPDLSRVATVGFVSTQKQRENLDWQHEQRMQHSAHSVSQTGINTRNGTPKTSILGSVTDPSVPLHQKLQEYKSQNE